MSIIMICAACEQITMMCANQNSSLVLPKITFCGWIGNFHYHDKNVFMSNTVVDKVSM